MTITLTPYLERTLQQHAQAQATTPESLVLDAVRRLCTSDTNGDGHRAADDMSGTPLIVPPIHFNNDLARFAGTWTQEEYEAFERATAVFGEIDREMWK